MVTVGVAVTVVVTVGVAVGVAVVVADVVEVAVIRAFVPGIAQPKGSLHRVRVGRRVVNSYKTDTGESWERGIIASLAGLPRIAGAVFAGLRFELPRPKSAPRRVWPHVVPDIDKLCRAVLDAIQRAGIYPNDSRVCGLHATKVYAPHGQASGVEMRLFPMAEYAPCPHCGGTGYRREGDQ